MQTINRRKFLQNGGALLLSIAALPSLGSHLIRINGSEIYHHSLGDASISVLKDFSMQYPVDAFFANHTELGLEALFKKYRVTNGMVKSDYNTMLIQSNGKNILIDTGIGYYSDPVDMMGNKVTIQGRLQPLLDLENVRAENIDYLIISHFHPDHIGGTFSEKGQLNFPNAQVIINKNEWDFWYSEQAKAFPEMFHTFIKNNITALEKEDIKFIKNNEEEILPGFTAIQSAGHTSGHVSFVISSNGEKMLYAADTFLHPIHMENLKVTSGFDADPEMALKSRKNLLGMITSENLPMHSFHFEFPGMGWVSEKGGHYKWSKMDV